MAEATVEQSVEEILAGDEGEAISEGIQEAVAEAEGAPEAESAPEEKPAPVAEAPRPKLAIARLGKEIDPSDAESLKEALIRLDEIARGDQSQARKLDAEMRKLAAGANGHQRQADPPPPPPKPKDMAEIAKTVLGEAFHEDHVAPMAKFGEEIRREAVEAAKQYIIKEFYPALWNQLQGRLPDETERQERAQAVWLRECAELAAHYGSEAPADLVAQAFDAIVAREEEAGRALDLDNYKVRRAVDKAAVDLATNIHKQRTASNPDSQNGKAAPAPAATSKTNGSPVKPPVSKSAPKPGAEVNGGSKHRITAASQEERSVEEILAAL
jgi:hypothetical protein